MPIVHTQIANTENNLAKVKFYIDPNSVHETALPGDHKQYSSVLTETFINCVDNVQNFKVRPDDIWIVGFIKTGTTWMHNIVNKFKFGAVNRDVIIADKLESEFFDKKFLMGQGTDAVKFFDDLPSPRIFKTHFPAFLLPKELWTVKPKIIYTSRNPKDVALSGYHMMRNSFLQYQGTLDDYCSTFINDSGLFMPFFDHVKGFLQIRHLDHVLFNIYEDMVLNQYDGIKRVNDFLGCSFTDAQLCDLMEDVSFNKMREEFPSQMAPKDRSTMADPEYR